MSRIPLFARGNLLKGLKCTDGFPDLDNFFQSNIPGLFITSMPATKYFGLFFAFTVSVLGSARIIGKFLSLGNKVVFLKITFASECSRIKVSLNHILFRFTHTDDMEELGWQFCRGLPKMMGHSALPI